MRWIGIALALLGVGVGFSAGLRYNPFPETIERFKFIIIEKPTYMERIVEVPVEVERIIEVPSEVTVEVPVIVEVEKIVYQNIYSREWESVEQFTDWYLSQGFAILFPSSVLKIDCDDYSTWVSRQALEQGYQVSIAVTWYGWYNNERVNNFFTQENPYHTGSLVEIQGVYYYFEPKIDEFTGLMQIARRD